MKNLLFLPLVLALFFPASSSAEEFLGAPVISQGKTVKKTADRLELKTGLSHDEVISFYRRALKGLEDIRFREWDDSTYIEDDGNLPWHSITVSKGDEDGTVVTIVKDNWTWIMGTLVLRYIGVFMVLMVLFIGMSISGKIISSSVKRLDKKKSAA